MSRLFSLLSRLLVGITLAIPACACASDATRSPERLSRCFQLYQLWARYETANCPNQTGQRAQAEWALSRCQVGDLESGFAELERLLRRDLISLRTAATTTALTRQKFAFIGGITNGAYSQFCLRLCGVMKPVSTGQDGRNASTN